MKGVGVLLLGTKLASGYLAFVTADWYKNTGLFLLIYLFIYTACQILINAWTSARPSTLLAVHAGKCLAWAYIGVVLFGGELISRETSYLTLMVTYHWVSSELHDGGNRAGKGMVLGAIVAVTLYPLDWDYEVTWQEYPFPILGLMEIGHCLGLVSCLFDRDVPTTK